MTSCLPVGESEKNFFLLMRKWLTVHLHCGKPRWERSPESAVCVLCFGEDFGLIVSKKRSILLCLQGSFWDVLSSSSERDTRFVNLTREGAQMDFHKRGEGALANLAIALNCPETALSSFSNVYVFWWGHSDSVAVVGFKPTFELACELWQTLSCPSVWANHAHSCP